MQDQASQYPGAGQVTMPADVPAQFMLPLDDSCTLYSQLLPMAGSPTRLALYQNSIHSLSLPSALWDAFQRACNRGASNQQLADIIKSDPVLAATLLRSVNSAGFGLRTPINDVGRAISHLGHSLTRSVVARHSFSSNIASKGKEYHARTLWKHGMAVSALAEIVARYIPGCDGDEAATLGLFHDVGRISFDLFTQFMQSATLDPEKGHLAYECARFGCTHIDLGVLLATHWELPEKIVQGIIYHHHPGHSSADTVPEEVRAEVLAVYLADLLAIRLGFAGGNPGLMFPHASFAGMLSKATLGEIMNDKRVSAELTRVAAIEF
ncbi:HDOD domain-containing protein [Mariprofundus erugo]|nr:HDOD domain-containing protein [Mariprofundus erugo]